MRHAAQILHVARCLLRQELRDRYNLFWMIVMPLGFIALLSPIYRSTSGDQTLGLTIVNLDGGFLSERLIAALGEEDLAVKVVSDTAEAAGGHKRRVTIPAGFSDSIAAGRRAGVRLTPRGSQPNEYDLAVEVRLYQAVGRTLTAVAALDTFRAGDRLSIESAEFRDRYLAMEAQPDRILPEVRVAGKGRTLPSGVAASAYSMLVLFVFMNTTITGAVTLAQEKQSRVLARQAIHPLPRSGLLAGKILGLLGIAIGQSAILLAAGRFGFGVRWGDDPLALLALLIALGLASAALGIFLGGVLRSPEQASSVAWLIPLFLGAIGGCWWPLEVVPHWMRVAGHLSPAAWAMDGIHGLLSFGKGPAAILVPSGVLLGYAIALTLGGARLLRATE